MADRLRPGPLAAVLGAAMLLLGGGRDWSRTRPGWPASAVFYGGYRPCWSSWTPGCSSGSPSRSRATVTSVAGLGVDLVSFGIYVGVGAR